MLDATLKLPVLSSDAGNDTVLQVYGINDSVSDKWPEQVLNWKNSLSESNLHGAKLLAEKSLAGVKAGQIISIEDKRITDLAGASTIKSVTLILKLKAGTNRVSFPSKEKKAAPQVSLELTVGK